MYVSCFDFFKVGIGPSSSHTIGPMVAARRFAEDHKHQGLLSEVARVKTALLASLAHTDKGQGMDRAVDPGCLLLAGDKCIDFDADHDLVFDTETPTPEHPNTLTFTAFDAVDRTLISARYYSIGGGFVLDEDEFDRPDVVTDVRRVPYPFSSCVELEAHCARANKPIHEILLENEMAQRSREMVESELRRIWGVMSACIEAGCATEGLLPGGLSVVRRAPAVYAYYEQYYSTTRDDGLLAFFLTATSVASLFKKNASISGAEVSCQGEVGVASSMAAAGLTAALGGSVQHVENAAEIAMEHSLGLTCDPVGGLMQIPCIERNAIGAVKVVDASRLALKGDGRHRASLDQAINTMQQTGADMQSIYKETSFGGLAVNVIEC